MTDELFTTTMRKATRKVHATSDALVNAKLIFALNNNKVWTEGLLIFYEVFRYLERAMLEKKDENLGLLFIPEMARTSAFEADLNFYLGRGWKKKYKMRDSVRNYISHLESLFESDSDLLMAYVYHLYMGLLSGGQILRKKKQLQSKIFRTNSDNEGEAVTFFENATIADLKTQLKDKMNAIADTLDEDKKALLIAESKKVFELNNSIIRSVKGTEKIACQNISFIISCVALLMSIMYYAWSVTVERA